MSVNNTVPTQGLLNLNPGNLKPNGQGGFLLPGNNMGVSPTISNKSNPVNGILSTPISNFSNNTNTQGNTQTTNQSPPTPIETPQQTALKSQLSTAQNSLQDLQSKQSALQKYNLNDASQLTKDASGNYIPNSTTAPTISNPYAATSATYPGYVGSLGNTPNQYNANNQSYQQLLASAANNPNIQQANQNIKDLTNSYANQQGIIANSPFGLSVQGGQESALSQQYAIKLNAAQQALASAQSQAGLQQTGYQGAGQLTQYQQELQQQALGAAAGYAQPQNANIFGTYNPLNPTQYTGYGGGSSNNGPGSAGIVSGNYSGAQSFQQTMVPSYQSAVNDANQFIQWLDTPASQGGGKGVNPHTLNAGNALLNWAQGQNYSNPQYPQLATYLNDFSSKLSSILGANSGEVTNYKQQLVNSMLNGTAETDSIKTQMQTMMDVATATMKGYAQTYGINWNPSGNTNISSSQTNNGGYTFNQNWDK